MLLTLPVVVDLLGGSGGGRPDLPRNRKAVPNHQGNTKPAAERGRVLAAAAAAADRCVIDRCAQPLCAAEEATCCGSTRSFFRVK